LDIAVGPYALGSSSFEQEYDSLARRHSGLLGRLALAHGVNMREHGIPDETAPDVQLESANHNARCFLAVEIENKVSRKHLLGGAFNAAALGRYGVMVGFTPDKLKALARLRGYMDLLSRVGKPTINVSHLFVLSQPQFSGCVTGT